MELKSFNIPIYQTNHGHKNKGNAAVSLFLHVAKAIQCINLSDKSWALKNKGMQLLSSYCSYMYIRPFNASLYMTNHWHKNKGNATARVIVLICICSYM